MTGLLEALVITVCIQGYEGCSQSTSAYYQQSKELKAVKKNVENYGKKLARNNEWLVYAATPMYAIAMRKPAKILVYRGVTLNIDPWTETIGFQWTY